MDRALEAASIMLSSRNPESRKTVVLITGGRNSQEAGANFLKRSLQRLSELGAEVIVVAFGNRFDAQELLPIVGQQQDIHPVQGSNDLVPYVSSLATYVISKPSGEDKKLQRIGLSRFELKGHCSAKIQFRFDLISMLYRQIPPNILNWIKRL